MLIKPQERIIADAERSDKYRKKDTKPMPRLSQSQDINFSKTHNLASNLEGDQIGGDYVAGHKIARDYIRGNKS